MGKVGNTLKVLGEFRTNVVAGSRRAEIVCLVTDAPHLGVLLGTRALVVIM